MDYESSSIDSSGAPAGAEAVKEQSEKQQQSYKKAQAQIQKAKKDEKKAKWDNDALFNILLRFIQNPFYEQFIPTITELLWHEIPSRFIINFTALIYPESALYVLSKLGRKEDIDLLLSLHRYEVLTDLDESTLHPSIRTWMSTWSQFTQQFLQGEEGSVIMHQKLLSQMQWNERPLLERALAESIQFFFFSRNINMPQKTAISYADFILKEHIKVLKTVLSTVDTDLTLSSDTPFDAGSLFGLSR